MLEFKYRICKFKEIKNPFIPLPGDYDDNGVAEFAFFRPSTGQWHIRLGGVEEIRSWGQVGDIPTPGDYDGDGKTDLAVWRPLTGDLSA